MAVKFNIEKKNDLKRQEYYLINPNEIHVGVNISRQGQTDHEEQEILEKVKSYEEHGQLTPVTVRKNKDNKPELVAGYGRYYAALKYNELHPDQPMMLKCIYESLTDEQAALLNIEENRQRKDTSPINQAHAHQYMRVNFNYTDTKIAEIYKLHQSQVSQLKKLLTLDRVLQDKIHKKELSVQAALALTELTKPEQQNVVQELEQGSGKIKTSEVVKKVREKKQEGNQNKTSSTNMSLKEIKEFWETLTGPAEHPKMQTLANDILEFMKGSFSDKQMEIKLKTALNI